MSAYEKNIRRLKIDICGAISSLLDNFDSTSYSNLREFNSICRTLFESVTLLHADGLYHFDIKNENLLYKKIGTEIRYVLADYGLLSTIKTKEPYKGTPPYMSLSMIYMPTDIYRENQSFCHSSLRDSECETIIDSYQDHVRGVAINTNLRADPSAAKPKIQENFRQ